MNPNSESKTPTPPSGARLITAECQPVFPCWLWGTVSLRWIHFDTDEMHRNHTYFDGPLWTYWHSDQPESPTCVPDATPAAGEAISIRIVKCTDEGAWYRSLVGQVVQAERFEANRHPSQGIPEDVYWCREGGMYNAINYIRASDVLLEPAPSANEARGAEESDLMRRFPQHTVSLDPCRKASVAVLPPPGIIIISDGDEEIQLYRRQAVRLFHALAKMPELSIPPASPSVAAVSKDRDMLKATIYEQTKREFDIIADLQSLRAAHAATDALHAQGATLLLEAEGALDKAERYVELAPYDGALTAWELMRATLAKLKQHRSATKGEL